MVYIQSDLYSLFSCPYLLSSLTPFGKEKKEQQKNEEYILHPLPHLHFHICLTFLTLYHPTYPHAGIWIFLVFSLYFYYPKIAVALATLLFGYIE